MNLIRWYEGLRLKPYQDTVGVWTQGYGETHGITKDSLPITVEIAGRMLAQRVEAIEEDMPQPDTQRHLNDNRMVRLRELGLQHRSHEDPGPAALSLLNRGLRMEFAEALLTWDKAGGVRVEGAFANAAGRSGNFFFGPSYRGAFSSAR